MRIRLTGLAGLVAALGLGPAQADPQPADCTALQALVEGATGFAITAPPAGKDGDWCVLDHARLAASREDQPDLKADTLRLTGATEAGELTRFALQVAGLRLGTGLGDSAGNPAIRQMFRLQDADLDLSLVRLTEDAVRLDLLLGLSGGTRLRLETELDATGLSPLDLVAARVRTLHLLWSPDPRLLRQALDAGSGAASGTEAVTALRKGLEAGIASLPGTLVAESDRKALTGFAAALPDARGLLDLRFASTDSIGLLDLVLAGRADPPFGPDALAALFAGDTAALIWAPGQAFPEAAPLE